MVATKIVYFKDGRPNKTVILHNEKAVKNLIKRLRRQGFVVTKQRSRRRGGR